MQSWYLKIIWCCCLEVLYLSALAQTPEYPPINENLFIQTKWKYAYTSHKESNTVIHRADKDYKYFLFFKYDYSYEMFLNGELTAGKWELNQALNEIKYPFRKITWWRIAEFTEQTLILEYSFHSKADYRYHFVRATEAEAPFVRAANDLPDVLVNQGGQNAQKYRYRNVKGQKGKRGQLNPKRKPPKPPKVNPEDSIQQPNIQIELVGGGFLGGLDPVYRNILIIKTDGRVVQELETEKQGLRVTKRTIPRQTLVQLAQFIEQHKFFDLQQTYHCESLECKTRMTQLPRPVALRIAVTYGFRRKVIIVPIWDGTGHQNALLSYPPELDTIVKAIQDTALY